MKYERDFSASLKNVLDPLANPCDSTVNTGNRKDINEA